MGHPVCYGLKNSSPLQFNAISLKGNVKSLHHTLATGAVTRKYHHSIAPHPRNCHYCLCMRRKQLYWPESVAQHAVAMGGRRRRAVTRRTLDGKWEKALFHIFLTFWLKNGALCRQFFFSGGNQIFLFNNFNTATHGTH
jgi:hypothetical protein